MSEPLTGFELRDHTADVALYVWGDTLEALFRSAADGLYAVIGKLEGTGQETPTEFNLAAGDPADLLGDFLSELLFIFDASHAMVTELGFDALAESGLRATATVRPLDMQRSRFDCEVKAVTRHNLAIHRTDRGYETTVILDL